MILTGQHFHGPGDNETDIIPIVVRIEQPRSLGDSEVVASNNATVISAESNHSVSVFLTGRFIETTPQEQNPFSKILVNIRKLILSKINMSFKPWFQK